jgi:hypothetical protein
MAIAPHPKPLTLVASVPMTRHLAALLSLAEGRRLVGLGASYDGLTLHIAPGECLVPVGNPIRCYHVTIKDAAVDVALTDNATNYVYVTCDGSNASIVANTGGGRPANSLPIFQADTSGGVVVAVRTVWPTSVDLGAPLSALGGDFGGQEVRNVGDATDDASAITRGQAMALMGAGMQGHKNPVRAATTGPITLSGLQTLDGVALNSGDRHLAAGQATASQNGIYVVQSGAWARADDFAASEDIVPGLIVPVSEGVANGNSIFGLDSDAPIVLGTTALVFSRRDVGAHQALTLAHGATSAPTPSTMMARDPAGRAQVEAGSAAKDLVNKGQMDAADSAEAAARAAADSAEATTRANADTAEAVARTNGDATTYSAATAYAVQRANHTGTQLASTISDFDHQVHQSAISDLQPATADIDMGGHRTTDAADPAAPQDLATLASVDARRLGAANAKMVNGSTASSAANLLLASLVAAAGKQLVGLDLLGFIVATCTVSLKLTFSDASTETISFNAGGVVLGNRCGMAQPSGSLHAEFSAANITKPVVRVDFTLVTNGQAGTKSMTISAFEVPQ